MLSPPRATPCCRPCGLCRLSTQPLVLTDTGWSQVPLGQAPSLLSRWLEDSGLTCVLPPVQDLQLALSVSRKEPTRCQPRPCPYSPPLPLPFTTVCGPAQIWIPGVRVT